MATTEISANSTAAWPLLLRIAEVDGLSDLKPSHRSQSFLVYA